MNTTALRLGYRLVARLVALATVSTLLLHAPGSAFAEEPLPPAQPAPDPGPPPGYPGGPPGAPAQPPVYVSPRVYAQPLPSGPEEISEFDAEAPVPLGYTKITRRRKGLLIGGAVTLGVTYGISMFVAAIGEDIRRTDPTSENLSALYIPVAGPFLQLRETESSTGRVYLLHLGLAQAAGAIMLGYGLTSPKAFLVRNDQLTISPMTTADGGSGMMVSGRF